MRSQPDTRRASIAIGAVLILVGAVFLLGRAVQIDVGWPVWIIGPGIVVLVLAFIVGGPGGAGFASFGAIVTAVGAILAVQEATNTYASWAYAWALVAPGSVGAGLLLYGFWLRHREMARGGLAAMTTGVVIFLIGFAFFEGVVRLNDLTGPVADLVVPAILVALGGGLIVAAFVPRGRRPMGGPGLAAAASPTAPAAGSGGISPGFAPTGQAADAGSAPVAGETAIPGATPSAGEAAAPGGTPPLTGPSAPDSTTGRTETLDLPLAAHDVDAAVQIAFGAGRLEIGPALPGRLVDGECDGGVVVQPLGTNQVRLSPAERWDLRLDRVPFDWLVGLSAEVPVRLSLEVGAADVTANLDALRVPDLRLRTGAAQVRVALPRTGVTKVDAEGGAAALTFRIPPGVAARIRSTMVLGSVTVDQARFPRQASGLWASADADSASDRVEIELRGGVGSVSVG